MKLTNHTWSIFGIARENDKDIGVGKDMFVANLQQSKATYHGADDLDYAALGNQWAALSPEDQTAQKQLYNAVTAVSAAGGRYKDLCAAWNAGEREQFEALVAEAVVALEKPDEGEETPEVE